ncbi:CotY/CotZ family spore coat protein [Virgibacillus sp. JSM 102003]|uniref:CotY/CotZ family spore coat protein n=1 Tax=Virgibacillus sp. JSM 102003 TaxID=1562108 RepID=UPI0035BF85A6
MLHEKDRDSIQMNKDNDNSCDCKSCICEVLSDILEQQRENKREWCGACSLKNVNKSVFKDTIPFILQTPYGHPFFTWGKVGTDDCFVTVFFKVIKVDCEKNCAVLKLLKPNVSIIDTDTDCVETSTICDVDYVTPTKECILVDLNCYSAVKCISPNFVKEHP